MKKLLSVFAAAAMLFSFASCSGDLHDDVYKVIDLSDETIFKLVLHEFKKIGINIKKEKRQARLPLFFFIIN